MRHLLRVSLAVLICLAPAWSQPATAQARPAGYLTSEQTSELIRVVIPAPAAGDPRYQADLAIFRETRSLEGSARWALAQADDNLSIAGLFSAFRCALGLALTPESAPQLTALLTRASSDAGAAAGVIKAKYQHKRPFQLAEGAVCVSARGKAALERNPDYPSGHTAIGWDIGLILAELAPRAASEILARARAYGQSRVVCGVHNASAVEAGWMTATAVFAMQENSPEFRRDLEAARAELAALRAHAKPSATGCEAEAETLAKNPY